MNIGSLLLASGTLLLSALPAPAQDVPAGGTQTVPAVAAGPASRGLPRKGCAAIAANRLSSMAGSRQALLASLTAAGGLAGAAPAGTSHSFGAFWEVGDGYYSTLILRNKDVANRVAARVILYASDGKIEQEAPIDVPPNAVSRLALGDLVKGDAGAVHWGGLAVEVTGAQSLMGSVIVENERQGILFDLHLQGGFRYDTENALYAPWWLPDGGTDGTLTLFNASGQSLVVSPSVTVEGVDYAGEAVGIAPHETRRLPLRNLLAAAQQAPAARQGAITLRYSGAPHALQPGLLLANAGTGFSLAPDFNARHDQPAAAQTDWRFPDVLLRTDAALGFTRRGKLTAYALLSNGTRAPLAPRITAFAGGAAGERVRQVEIPTAPLAPLETRLIQLSKVIGAGLPAGGASHVALEVSHAGAPGDLGVTLFSVGPNHDFVFRSEGTVHPSKLLDSSYWDIAGDLVALLTVQNTSDVALQARATLLFRTPQGGAGTYTLPLVKLPPRASQILSLKQLILSGAADGSGHRIPAGTTFGTLTLEVVDKEGKGFLFGGSTSLDPARGGYGELIDDECDFCDSCEDCEDLGEGPECVPSCDSFECCEPPPPPPSVSIACDTTDLGFGPDPNFGASSENGICRTTVANAGGTYTFTANKNTITLTNPGDGTASYVPSNPSTAKQDTSVTVSYADPTGGTVSATFSGITVHKPTSLRTNSTTVNDHTITCTLPCLAAPNTGSCTVRPGTTCSYQEPITRRRYSILDQFGQAFESVNLGSAGTITESVTATVGSCGGNQVTTAETGGSPFMDDFGKCDSCCEPGGPGCQATAQQTIFVNGFAVRSEAIVTTCTSATLTP